MLFLSINVLEKKVKYLSVKHKAWDKFEKSTNQLSINIVDKQIHFSK